MSYKRKQEDKRRLETLYSKTRNKCSGGAYFDKQKGRIVKYSLSDGSDYKRYLKNLSNRKIRKSNIKLDNGDYKKLFDYWWILFWGGNMKRVFIMRKDLHMSPGKLAAQVGHCAEAYWTHGFREHCKPIDDGSGYVLYGIIDKDIFEDYICGRFVKVICQARNKNHLLKAIDVAKEMELIEGEHYGLIYDSCLTELEPEEEDGTTLTGIWFCPLVDYEAEKISKKYHLYT